MGAAATPESEQAPVQTELDAPWKACSLRTTATPWPSSRRCCWWWMRGQNACRSVSCAGACRRCNGRLFDVDHEYGTSAAHTPPGVQEIYHVWYENRSVGTIMHFTDTRKPGWVWEVMGVSVVPYSPKHGKTETKNGAMRGFRRAFDAILAGPHK